jgi:DNA-binding transcriptional ArsR family regulator
VARPTLPSAARWDLYRVLSEPVRLRTLALAAAEELSIGEMAELLEESQPNVSRHVSVLRQVGLLDMRRQGTRTLVRINEAMVDDPVVADAIGTGKELCEAAGCFARMAELIKARETLSREFFTRGQGAGPEEDAPPDIKELDVYLSVIGPLLPRRALALDIGTGDGRLLHVLAPLFERVVAVDLSPVQLGLARRRVEQYGYRNVTLLQGDPDSAPLRKEVGGGADAVFAVRLLHHAARPARLVRTLAELCHPEGGALVVLDYLAHDDERMRQQADLWLGFEPNELRRLAEAAGLSEVAVLPVASPGTGRGPDGHLGWQVLVGRRKAELPVTGRSERPIQPRKVAPVRSLRRR